MSFFPLIKPEILTGYFPLGYRGSPLNEIYINSPFLYVTIYIVIISLYSGAYSLFSFGISCIFNHKTTVIVMVFLFTLAYKKVIYFFELYTIDIGNLIFPPLSSFEVKWINIIIILISIILFSILLIALNNFKKNKR